MEGKGILAVFLVPIVAVILLGIIWSTVQTATTIQTATNESFTGVNDTFVYLDYPKWAANPVVRNINNTVMTITTHYVVDLTRGRLNVTSAGAALSGTIDDLYYADYTYMENSYLESSMSRTIVGYLPLIFALVILVFIAGFVVLKKRAE